MAELTSVKILLVEDESIEAMDIKRTLESFGYEVPYIASRGEEAIVKALDIMPDLILMDIILKGDINGVEVASKLKDLNMPVIYLTAHSEESTVQKAKLTEPYGYILKPYDPLELKCAIDIALHRKSEEKLRDNEEKLRRKAEDELKKANKYNRSLIEASLDPLVTIGRDGKITDVNKAIERATGYLRDDIIGSDFSDYFTEPDKARKGYQLVFQEGFVRDYPLEIQNKDGHVTPVIYNASVYKDETGEVVGVFAAARDITDRKIVEEKIKESEENFRAMAENASEGIIIATAEGIHVYANQMAAEITGYTVEELLKTSMSDLAHSDEINKHMGRHEALIKGGTVSPTCETCLVRKNGAVIPVEFTAAKTVWKGQPAVIALFRDISERKKDEEEFQKAVKTELQESEELNYLTLSNISDAVFITDNEGKFIFICPNVHVIFGYSLSEVQEMDNISKLLGEKDLFLQDLERLGEIRNIERDITDKSGETHNLLVNIKKVSIKGGKYLYSCRDVTERKKAEDALKKSYAELEHRVEERTSELREANRELQAIGNCNQAMLRAVDEQTLVKDICHIICDEAGYRLAWVGYAEHDDAKTIRPVAWAGYDSGYIAHAKLSWSEDKEHGQGPAGIVIRSGEMIYVQDFQTDPLMAPWRESALQRGYHSGIALPLKDKKSKTFGALLIYSAEPNAITPDEIWLMEELAGNLAFGIISLREQAERKRAEEKLKLASLYNRSLIEASLDPLVTIGPTGKITDVNKATEAVTGFSRDELIGTDFGDYFTEPDKAKKGYKQVFNKGVVRDYPLEILHKDGDVTPVIYNASLYKDESGEVGGVFAAARDITERKEAEKKLKDSEERMRLTLEATQIGVWDWDVKNDQWYASPVYYSMLGYEPRSGPGDRLEWLERVHPDDRTRVKEKIDNVLIQNFNSYEYEARMRHVNGTYRWVSVVGFGIERDPDGKATRILGIRMDITDRKKAEEEIKLASLYNRSLIEASLDPLVTIGPDGKITDVNNATEKITGFSRDELIGKDFSDYFTEPDKAREGYQQVFEEGFVRDYPLEIKNKDGHVTSVLYNASLYMDEDGEIVGVFAAARDITESEKAEEKIQLLANVVESSDDAIITKSLEGSVTSWNKGAELIYGYSSEEIVGKDISILAPPKYKNEIRDLIEKIKRGEHVIHYETKRVRKDGNQIIVSLTLSPIFDTAGALIGISTIARDITESKKNEDAIFRAKEEWEHTFDAVPDLIAILDTNYHVVRANKAMADRLGVDTEEAVGVTCYEVVHGLNAPPSFCPHCKLLEDGQEHTAEVHEDRIGGDFIVSVSPLYDSEGKLMGSVHVARDITDRKRAEDKVIKSLKEKEVLLSEIHHRVKNNMQIISSLLNLQSQYVTADETADVLQESQDRVKAMATIYEKLYLSKDLNKINFNNYIQSLVQGLFYSHVVKEGQITPVIEIEDIMLNIETAIPCGLIISELVSNSIKHAFPDDRAGKLHISLKTHDDNVYGLNISDDGIGFPEDIDFKNTNTLGLQLVNNLVEQIEGQIMLDRSHGTRFEIIFKELEYKKRI